MFGNPLDCFFWTGVGLLSGSLMFSYWIGKLSSKDVRDYGDGNPGAANAWKAGGWKIGLPGALLDFAKGAVPVGIAHWGAGIEGWLLVPVALAPIVGHAFSPFLKFRGGKAVAVTLGVWTGVTVWEGIGILGILMGIMFAILATDGWPVLLAMAGFLVYLLVVNIFIRGFELPIFAIWTGNMAIITYKHRHEAREAIRTRAYVTRLFRRAS